MNIKERLNGKQLNNKVAEKAKKLTAAVLMLGTIFAGVGLASCGQKTDMTDDELASAIVNAVQEHKENFEFSDIIFANMDNQYMMVISNGDFSDYVGYEISKSEFNKLIKSANESDSDYIVVSPNGDSFVITKGGINDVNLRDFNEIVFSTISKGKTIDVSQYIQTGSGNQQTQTGNSTIDFNNCNDREYIEFGIAENIRINDKEHKFDGFKADYILVYAQKEYKREISDSGYETWTIENCFEFVDVFSVDGDEDPDTKKVAVFTTFEASDFDMEGFMSLLETKSDGEKIKKIENGYFIDTGIYDDENMTDVNAYLRKIAIGSGVFWLSASYEEPLQQEEIDEYLK